MNMRGRVDASVWALFVPLWIYAALVGVLSAVAGRLLVSSEAHRWLVTVGVVVVGSACYPVALSWLRRVLRNHR